MNEIEIISKVKREKLDERNYFKTLIEVAYEEQMLTDNDIVNLQIQVLQLLDEKVYKYNGSESSSIRKEILEEISNSNNYTIGIYLKTFKNPDEAVKIIKENGLESAYQEGRKKIDKMYLLYGYSHDYKELIINIFEIVLLEVIACKLVNRDIKDLTISTAELNEIYLMFENKDKVEIENIINKIYKEICDELLLDNGELRRYIKKNLNSIVEIIYNEVKQGALDKIFITQKII